VIVMALDLGTRTCGIAISDAFAMFAKPYAGWRFETFDADDLIAKLKDVYDKENIEEIVLGLPKNMDGTLGAQAQMSMQFAEALKGVFPCPVTLYDERLTSRMAASQQRLLGKKKKQRQAPIDAYAASIILQDYLDHKKNKENTHGR